MLMSSVSTLNLGHTAVFALAACHLQYKLHASFCVDLNEPFIAYILNIV